MIFDWITYIYLADELLTGTDEAYYRSAISRAYYGVFCIARDRKGYSDYKKSDAHSKVIENYVKSSDEDERIIATILIKLRRARNYADYDANVVINREMAKMMVNSAKAILDILGIQYDDFKNNGGKE
ncbi:MAG: hypothetical protein AAB116_16750 [Candidatus Poribacteria bacterium]